MRAGYVASDVCQSRDHIPCHLVPAPNAKIKSQVALIFVSTAAILTFYNPLGELKRCNASVLEITLAVGGARERERTWLTKYEILAFLASPIGRELMRRPDSL